MSELSRIEKLLKEINGNLGKSSGGGVKPDWSVDAFSQEH